MKLPITLILSIISLCLYAQNKENEKVLDTVYVTFGIYEQFSDIKLDIDTSVLNIDFKSISKFEFESYREKYGQKIDTITKFTSHNQSAFSINVSDTIIKFQNSLGRNHHYGGFYPKLNCHLIKVSGNGICEIFLIDQKTGNGLILPVFFDDNCNPPKISNDNSLLMTYGTCQDGSGCLKFYEHFSTISIFQIKNTNSITELEKYRFIEIKDLTIQDIFWIENNSVVIKAFNENTLDKNGQNNRKNIQYIRGTIHW